MHYTFKQAPGLLRAELFGRQTPEETHEFVEALLAEAQRLSLTRVLAWVRNSRPVFKVEHYDIRDKFRRLAARGVRVALLADSDEVRASHQYLEVLAGQQGAHLRAFRDEARALHWLSGQSHE